MSDAEHLKIPREDLEDIYLRLRSLEEARELDVPRVIRLGEDESMRVSFVVQGDRSVTLERWASHGLACLSAEDMDSLCAWWAEQKRG